jgi:hypothetical protein
MQIASRRVLDTISARSTPSIPFAKATDGHREFIRTLALKAGHRLTWAGLTPEENNEASRVSYATGNGEGLAAIIRKRLR